MMRGKLSEIFSHSLKTAVLAGHTFLCTKTSYTIDMNYLLKSR